MMTVGNFILESGFQSGSQECNVLGSFQVAQSVYNVKVNSKDKVQRSYEEKKTGQAARCVADY